MTRVEEVSRLFGRIATEFDRLDIFVSNARPETPAFSAPPLTITLDQWNAAFNSQASAFLVGAREAAKLMRDGGPHGGHHLRHGGPDRRPPTMGRNGRGQVGLGNAGTVLRGDVGPPWYHRQRGESGLDGRQCAQFVARRRARAIRDWHTRGWTPMGRLGTPADIGNVVALLCGEEAGWITGQLIVADGGSSLMNPEVPPELQLG